MAEGDLTLTARLRLEVDPAQVRAEMQKAGGMMGQAMGGGGMAGGLAQRAGGGGPGVLGMVGAGAAGGAAVIGSYIVLQRILRLMENSPLFSSTLDLITGGIGQVIGATVDKALGEKGTGALTSFGADLYEFAADIRGGGTNSAIMKLLMTNIFSGLAPMAQQALGPLGPGGSNVKFSYKDFLPGGALWNGIMPSAYAMEAPGALDTTAFMMQWAAENPGGGIGMGGPPVVGGMRSAGTYDTLLSQLMSGTSLARTSQWGNTDIGAQGQWWGPSASSGDILSRIQKYYQIANYGGAVPNGWGWGDVSKQIEKMLSDPNAPKDASYLMNQVASYIEPMGRTWWRSSEYGNSMADVMTMGSPGITPPDIGTLFSGLTFAPEIKVTIGAQELNDIITQIIESGNFTTRTAI